MKRSAQGSAQQFKPRRSILACIETVRARLGRLTMTVSRYPCLRCHTMRQRSPARKRQRPTGLVRGIPGCAATGCADPGIQPPGCVPFRQTLRLAFQRTARTAARLRCGNSGRHDVQALAQHWPACEIRTSKAGDSGAGQTAPSDARHRPALNCAGPPGRCRAAQQRLLSG